uniref:ARAD1A10076p n=1 Tax=Blastobotrys adeninivorans TaxID=409370 RepID=A0A060SY72_BLAAD
MSFTDKLKEEFKDVWAQAVDHKFVKQLYDGSVPDEVMKYYLIQDYKFVDTFLALVGMAVATADTLEARLRYCRFLGMCASDENTYFEKALEELGASKEEQDKTAPSRGTKAIEVIMRRTIESNNYGAVVAVLYVAEGVYLDWAMKAPKPLPEKFIHSEWIRLHDNPDFRDYVGFLKSELDRVGPSEPLVKEFFKANVEAERDFFDSLYD